MNPTHMPTETGGRGERTPVRSWLVQSTVAPLATPLEDGEVVSRPGYAARGWYTAPPRSTVMAVLLANGCFSDIERSTNLRDLVDPAIFQVPWWYRSTFISRGSARIALRLDGVIHKADLFVNGRQVATADEIAGAYAVSRFDVSDLVSPGENAIALRVHPGSPLDDLSISWVDWNQWPPDNNMGVWRDVVIERTGEVRLGDPAVSSTLSSPSFSFADLSIAVELANESDLDITADVRGVVSGHGSFVEFARAVHLEPRGKEHIRFTPDDSPGLRLSQPALWWPLGEGSPDRYDLELSASVGGLISDQRTLSFGVRSVTSHVEKGGGRRFVVNGRPQQIVGGGWSPDLFLRYDPARIADELGYVAELGFNTVRLEGKLENPEFFELADAMGIMVLPGWECCSKWEAEKGPQGSEWTEHDYAVADRSMRSEAILLRNHPSVIGFVIGSDFAPPPRTASIYVDALNRAGWSMPIISSATAEATDAAGPSGMKMTGPYAWVPPVYWYSTSAEHGGAVGFNSETAAGANIPRQPSLERMLSPSELESLWREPAAKQFHAGPPSEFDNLAIFHRALAGRYGAVTSLRDFVRKAQLANYEATRAQFEAYLSRTNASEPATGVIYWMLNSAWPSLNWQLYDWYLDPAGAFFGAKKACEPTHPFYDYGNKMLGVINRRRSSVGPCDLSARIVDIDGMICLEDRAAVAELAPGAVASFDRLEIPPTVGATYLLDLRLVEQDTTLARNVYWLSAAEDVLDWPATTWQYTPTARFADLSGLERLGEPVIETRVVASSLRDGMQRVRVELRNASEDHTPAIGVHAAVTGGGPDTTSHPVHWTDNDVTIFAGELVTLEATFPIAPGAPFAIDVDAFNRHKPTQISAEPV